MEGNNDSPDEKKPVDIIAEDKNAFPHNNDVQPPVYGKVDKSVPVSGSLSNRLKSAFRYIIHSSVPSGDHNGTTQTPTPTEHPDQHEAPMVPGEVNPAYNPGKPSTGK